MLKDNTTVCLKVELYPFLSKWHSISIVVKANIVCKFSNISYNPPIFFLSDIFCWHSNFFVLNHLHWGDFFFTFSLIHFVGVVIICLEYLTQGRGALQDIDQMSLFKPLCKYCASITKIRDIVPTLKKALHEAQSGTPGISRSRSTRTRSK